MKFKLLGLLCFLVASVSLVGVLSAQEGPAPATSKLKEFANNVDEAYRFEVVDKRQIGSSRVARLHMVSQKWKDVTWKHVVWIIVPSKAIEKPDDAASRSAILLVDGGGWSKQWGENAPPQVEPRAEFQVLKGIAEAAAHADGSLCSPRNGHCTKIRKRRV
jgi:PhoPQ-activated pathogenicity-related protein